MARHDGDGWARCDLGHTHWEFRCRRAAGLAARARRDPVQVLLHRRGWTVHYPRTWGPPGGARDSHESEVHAALREAAEEIAVPDGVVRPTGIHLDDHGGWSYRTVLAEADEPFRVRNANRRASRRAGSRCRTWRGWCCTRVRRGLAAVVRRAGSGHRDRGHSHRDGLPGGRLVAGPGGRGGPAARRGRRAGRSRRARGRRRGPGVAVPRLPDGAGGRGPGRGGPAAGRAGGIRRRPAASRGGRRGRRGRLGGRPDRPAGRGSARPPPGGHRGPGTARPGAGRGRGGDRAALAAGQLAAG
jgi:hypothetical protein